MSVLSVCTAEGNSCVHQGTTHFDELKIKSNLQNHLIMLTRTIGARSVRLPGNIEKSAVIQ